MGQLDTGHGAWFSENEQDNADGGQASEEALAYLKSVNSEAIQLGPITSRNASRMQPQHAGKAYFDDSAWVSIDAPSGTPPEARFRTLADAQEHFLLKSVLDFRATLRNGTATSNALGPAPTRTKLREHMLARDAAAPELRNMARETQLNAVRELTEMMSWGALTGGAGGRRLQGWLFAVMGRLEDAGGFFIDDVNVVRALAKHALRISVDQVRAIAKSVDETRENGKHGMHDGDEPVRESKRRKTTAAAATAPENNSDSKNQEAMPGPDGHASDQQKTDSEATDMPAEAVDPTEIDEAMSMSSGEMRDDDEESPMSMSSPSPSAHGNHNRKKPTDTTTNNKNSSNDSYSENGAKSTEQDPYALPAAPPSAAGSAFASLDMVLTVVGRVYRQVDLLEKKRQVFTQVRY